MDTEPKVWVTCVCGWGDYDNDIPYSSGVFRTRECALASLRKEIEEDYAYFREDNNEVFNEKTQTVEIVDQTPEEFMNEHAIKHYAYQGNAKNFSKKLLGYIVSVDDESGCVYVAEEVILHLENPDGSYESPEDNLESEVRDDDSEKEA